MTVLHLKSFDNKHFKLDFFVSKRNVFLRSNPLRKMNFLHGCDIFFFQNSCSFPCIKTLLKVSNPVFEKIRHESITFTLACLNDREILDILLWTDLCSITLRSSKLCIKAILEINPCRLTIAISSFVLLSQLLFVLCLLKNVYSEGKGQAASTYFQIPQGPQLVWKKCNWMTN